MGIRTQGFLKRCWEWTFIGAASLGIGLLPLGLTDSALADGGTSGRVELRLLNPLDGASAGPVDVSFELYDRLEHRLLTDQDLAVDHEKKLHFLVFDEALKEFVHEHPVYEGGAWRVQLQLSRDGSYALWGQGVVGSDGEDFSVHSQIPLVVTGGLPANPPNTNLGDVRAGVDGNSAVRLSTKRILAKQMNQIPMSFSRTDGSEPSLSPWLGSPAHVLLVPAARDEVIHIHPVDHGIPNQLTIHAFFPAAGEYRVWAQFIDGGTLRTVPLSVAVVEP